MVTLHTPPLSSLHTPQTTGGCQDWSYVRLTYVRQNLWPPPQISSVLGDHVQFGACTRINQCFKISTLMTPPFFVLQYSVDVFFTCNSNNDDWHLNNRTNLSNHHYMSNYLDNLLNFSLRWQRNWGHKWHEKDLIRCTWIDLEISFKAIGCEIMLDPLKISLEKDKY